MTVNRVFDKGETVEVCLEVRTRAGVLFNPSYAKLAIANPSGTVALAETDFLNISTGIYHYYYLLDAAAPVGWWNIRCKITDGTVSPAVIVIDNDGFEVK